MCHFGTNRHGATSSLQAEHHPLQEGTTDGTFWTRYTSSHAELHGWADCTEVPHIPVGDGHCVYYSDGELQAKADNWKDYMVKTYTKNTAFIPLNKKEYILMGENKE